MKLKVVDVREGDTLWSVAEDHLGSGQMWRDVLVSNSTFIAESIGDEMAKTLKVLAAGTQLVVPIFEDDDDFQPSGM